MRIERIAVVRFGPLRDLDISVQLPAAGGVVVLEGPNEAGKSTLLRFVRSLLFGGEAVDGALVVEHGGGRFRIEQRGARSSLSLIDLSNGRPLEPTRLQHMVGNLDANVYGQVFAFGLAELQTIAALTGEGVQERIFSAAVVGAGRSVREAQRGLATEIQRLWRPRSASAIRQSAQQLQEALRLVGAAEGAAAEWPRLLASGDDLAARITSLEHQIVTVRGELRCNELLLELHERWSSRRAAQEQLAAAPQGERVPEETVERLAILRPEVNVLRSRDNALSKQVADLEPAASAPVPHKDLLPLADRIAGVLAGVPVQRQRLEEDLPKSLSGMRTAEALLASALALLGPDWTEERLAAFPLSSARSADIDAFALEFEGLKRQRIELATGQRASVEALQRARNEAAARRAAGADLEWLGAAQEIRSLCATAAAHQSRVERLERLGVELRQNGTSLEGVLGRLGPAWDEGRVADFTAHAQWRRAGEEAGALAEAAAEERRKGQLAAEAARTRAKDCRDDLDALEQPGRGAAEAERAVNALRAEVACLEELGGALQEWRQSQQNRQAAEAALTAAESSLRRPRALANLVVAVVPPLLLAASLARSRPLVAVALAVLAGLSTALNWPRRADPLAQSAVERARDTHREAERQLEATGRRLQELGERAGLVEPDLGGVHGALSRARAREEDLRREQEACRTWAGAAEALRQAEQRVAETCAEAEAGKRREAETRLRWRAWCDANALPDHLRPGDLPAFLADLDRAKELAQGVRAARAEAAALRAAVDDWRRRAQGLAAHLATGQPLSPEESVDALQRELERAAALDRALTALEDAERVHAEATRSLEELDRSLVGLGQRWGAWCRDQGLPGLAAPEDGRAWVRDARAATEQAARVRALRADRAALQSRRADWEAQASALLRDAGQAVADGGLPLVRAIEALAADLRTAEGAAAEREQARTALERLQLELGETRAEISAKEAEISALLAGCGAESEADLAERLRWQTKRQEWLRTIREAEQELGRRTGQDAETIARLLDENAPLRWRENADGLRERLPELEARLNDRESGLRMQLGELRSRREALEVSGDIARHRLLAGQRGKELAEALRRWVVCRLADGLIGDTLKEYERRHVPEVIRSASERFARITGGRYQSVHAVEGGRFRVATGPDAVLDAGQLSRGTQEQLYLVVRLGLVDSFSRQSASLPLVLDDVLVNADPERREGLIRVLVDASQDHQTIVLTCHPEVSAAIRRQAPGAQVLGLERISGPVSTAATPSSAEPGVPAPRMPAIVLAALREHAEGVGSGPLCALLGITAVQLRDLLVPLLESGAVVREGRARGTKYRLADARTA